MSGKYNESNQSISCSVCKQCGGCQYVDIPYEKELKKKSAYLKQLFEGICTVGEVHGMYRPAFYRNKVHAVVGLDKQKGIVTGTYAEGTHRLVPVDVCMIEDQKADSIIATLRELFASFKYVPYNEDTHRGFMRHILIRRGFSTKEMMVVLVTADNKFPSKNNFLKALLEKHPDITTVVQNINDYSTSMVLGKANKVLYGKGYIEDVLCGCRFRISPESFYQINPSQTEKLYKTAIRLGGITKNDVVIDAYCGIGTIGIALSSHAKKVIGVELNPQAVKDAQTNADLNHIKNIQFVNEDAGDFLVCYAEGGRADVVIMDPPRSGSTPEFLQSLLQIKPKRIVYISCNPETQVRDVRVLQKGGYKVEKCDGYDMFPHTVHVETVVKLSLKKDTPKIEVTMEPDEESNYTPEEKITYQKIKAYILEKYGFKVSSLYIAQIKDKCGLGKERTRNNWKKNDKSKEPQCTPEKEEAIRDAFKNFNII